MTDAQAAHIIALLERIDAKLDLVLRPPLMMAVSDEELSEEAILPGPLRPGVRKFQSLPRAPTSPTNQQMDASQVTDPFSGKVVTVSAAALRAGQRVLWDSDLEADLSADIAGQVYAAMHAVDGLLDLPDGRTMGVIS